MSSAAGVESNPSTPVYYVASTHWDREWYEPLAHYRFRLARLMDEVLDLLEADAAFRCFQTDGVSILIEDYLEVRPERREQVNRLAEAGRLRIGPWYTMPDEHLAGGESLIRNLELGLATARANGAASGGSRAGFVCDIFGHVGQLPQILRGFCIDNALLWRGANDDTHGGAFRWQSPDGSEVGVYRFGRRRGYCMYPAEVRQAFDPQAPFSVEDALPRLVDYVRRERERMNGAPILLFDGCDHLEIEPRTSELLARAAESMPECEFIHAGLDEYMRALAAHPEAGRRSFAGELRDPGRLTADGCWLIPGVLSSRVDLKLANRRCESELLQWAEPFAAWAAVAGTQPHPDAFLRLAWRHLLQNHAHDSIGGCSTDHVHRDVQHRFDQARLTAERVTAEALQSLADRVELPPLSARDFAVVLFNPTQTRLDGPHDVTLRFPTDAPDVYQEFFGFEPKLGFRLFDAKGHELPYDYLAHRRNRRGFTVSPRKVPQLVESHEVDIAVAATIPPLGYATLICRPQAGPTRHPHRPIAVGDAALENEHLRVEVGSGGMVKLLDKRTGQTYERLGVFEDRADIGDGWYHGLAVSDEVLTSAACGASVALVENGSFKATLRITPDFRVPECWLSDRLRRSDQRVALSIETYVTLRRGADHLECRTVVNNTARDHRLRVLFDSGTKADTYFADSAFDVVERPIALPTDRHTYKELAVETGPQANWTAVLDKERGLAVVAPGLYETAVCDVPARLIALTLLRSFSRTVFTSGEVDGQLPGRWEFRYLLVPLRGELPRTRLCELAQWMQGGVRGVQRAANSPAEAAPPGAAMTGGMLTLSPGIAVVTSFRKRGDRLELRMFNPASEETQESISFGFAIRSAGCVTLEGEPQEPAQPSGPTVSLKIPPKRIVTLSVRPQ